MLTIQTVDFAGKSFFWYNGSMYYTGFFSVTLVFLGVVSRYFYDGKKYRIPIMLLLAVFLGGGNYVSLLPAIISSVTITIVSFFVCPKQSKYIGMVTLILVAGLMISAVAPGKHEERGSIMGQGCMEGNRKINITRIQIYKSLAWHMVDIGCDNHNADFVERI